jgi:hypothetical protein
MIPRSAEISVFRIPLDVAGESLLRQRTGYFHLWQFENIADGTISLDGQISAVFGSLATVDDAVPFGYNSRVQFRPPVDQVNMRWNAQPGIRAVVLVSFNPDALEASNIPARQLVFQGQAPTLTTQAATVGTVAAQVIPANSFRQRLVIQAPSGNAAHVIIGPSGVTLGSGVILEPGGVLVLNSSAAIFAISSLAGQGLRIMEERA